MSSTGGLSRRLSRSSASKSSTKNSAGARHNTPPPTALTPENLEAQFEPCAATASFLLYAQQRTILVLHQDTLAIERRFSGHAEVVSWISVDNASERGSGRLAVSSDAGKTTIVWDILTGGEVARFSSYEHMLVANFMRNGNIAFGNDKGNIVLFEPSTSEHISARTIYDPITAIAPSADCRTFAIGYMNGSILIATLQPSFTILHTLTTTRAPSRITGLAWHGSSSKQKTDMLATQTMDGDLRVWSVPKAPSNEQPNIIRVLQRADVPSSGPCWFAWSKNGRIVQYAEGETRAWDVRTKKVSWDLIPTGNDVVGMANYGPSATLFTLSRSHIVQQFDITPNNVPMQVASVQHVPANTPPTPPTNLEESRDPYSAAGLSLSRRETPSLPTISDTGESSADENTYMSPIEKIAREMDSLDALQSEIRDKVMPLSPTSSRASSASSRSSGARRRGRKYLYDRPESSRASSGSTYEPTEFSMGTASASVARPGHESISIRSVSSFASASNSRYRPTNLRKELLRSPQEANDNAAMDLFPHTRAKLREVAFRTPHYGNAARTPDLLQREMLSVVFGWNDDARALIRFEMEKHRPGSASSVLLSKWLGDIGADNMASMVGAESMTSSDWMLLALSSIGADSQKKVGEAFVHRLLEKGDVHPAVAILLGLGEHDDAIEVYVSQQYWLEAVLLTCIMAAASWERICNLLRRWGEAAVQQGQPELAVRCFSCTSIETSEPWFSPRAQDAVYTAQQERFTRPPSAGGMTSPPISPPSRSASGRLTAKNASLKLITTFGEKGTPVGVDAITPLNAFGVTPIAQSAMPSALSPGGIDPWSQRPRNMRDPSSTRTATPGGFSRRKRLPSRTDIERAKQEAANLTTPITAAREYAPMIPAGHSRRTSSVGSQEPATALKASSQSDRLGPDSAYRVDNHLPSPAQGAFSRLKDSHHRQGSTDRKPEGLAVHIMETQYTGDLSPVPGTGSSRAIGLSPSLTSSSTSGVRSRAVGDYISSVDEAREHAREKRAQSRRRGDSRKRDEERGHSRNRDLSEGRGRHGVRYIKPAKRSPSSPVPMSPEEIAQATNATRIEPATTDDESFYKIASPVESHRSARSARSEPKLERRRPSLASANEGAPPVPPKPLGQNPSRQPSPDGSSLRTESFRGRSDQRTAGSAARSPSSPLPMASQSQTAPDQDETNSDGRRVRLRAGSRSDEQFPQRRQSRGWRERSTSRKPAAGDESNLGVASSQVSKMSLMSTSQTSAGAESDYAKPRGLSRKELAARELEERRLSLARRPSAPTIPLPGETSAGGARPILGPRAYTELGNSPTSNTPPFSRSQTVDPDAMSRYGKMTGISSPSVPIGLPATPRAMRHPRYMGSEGNKGDFTPPVPEIPDNASQLSSIGSNLSHMTGSNVESTLTSNLTSNVMSNMSSNMSHLASNVSQVTSSYSQVSSNRSQLNPSELDDGVAPLLPSTVFGQKPPSRSASAPPENASPIHATYKPHLLPSNRRLSHVRKISPPDAAHAVHAPVTPVSSIDETLAGSSEHQVIIIPEVQNDPPVLAELQHLNMPPPPPPPPTMYSQPGTGPLRGSGMISIAMDDSAPTSAVEPPSMLPSTTYPQPMERAATTSPSAHRRGRGSVSETFGSRFRGFGERMRSTSRNRTKSPQDYKPPPYETVLPPFPPRHQRGESIGRAQSPYEQAMAAQTVSNQDQVPPPPPPPPVPMPSGSINETAIPPPPLSRTFSAMAGYRNPKDIRANMPPDTLQHGVQGGFL